MPELPTSSTPAPLPRLSDPERWVDEHGDYLFKYALSRLRDPVKAEDAGVSFINGTAPIFVSGSWWYCRFVEEAGFDWTLQSFPDTQLSLGSSGNLWVVPENAANKVKALIEEEGNNELKLRVFVTGGGCSGLQYGFTFDEVTNEDDTVMQKNGVSLLIDPMSYQYLVGAEIDYTEGLEGAHFVIKNPNATSTCGCGSSFSA